MSFESVDLALPASATESTPVNVSPRSPIMVGLSGTFVATVQFQWSPDASGSVWHSLGSAMTAGGVQMLPAGRARRIRADVTAYTSGTPVGTMLHDTPLSAYDVERSFWASDLDVALSATEGDPLTVPDGEQMVVSVSGTFTATLQLQYSLSEAGSDWYTYGPTFTAGFNLVVPRGMAKRIRLDTVAYTSGTPVATVQMGLAIEPVLDQEPETVASGALSLLTEVSLVSVTGTAAYTLADGTYIGQKKRYICTVAASTPNGTLTPATFADGTSLDIDAVGESAELVWTSSGWRVVSLVGSTITP